ncbi:hypothetical protein Tco_0960286 [Tanacetum coccineum]
MALGLSRSLLIKSLNHHDMLPPNNYDLEKLLTDVVLAKETKLEKVHEELKVKCDSVLVDLENNPLVHDLRDKIKSLEGQLEVHKSEYGRLLLEEKKWVSIWEALGGKALETASAFTLTSSGSYADGVTTTCNGVTLVDQRNTWKIRQADGVTKP